jgi:uncharacterized protein YbjT (DUF2867 family)
MKVLMIGATGQFAGRVVPEMKKRGVEVYALIQNPDKQAIALKNGADHIIIGNLNNDASLVNATKGMDGVFHINPAFAPNEAAMGLAMVNAARVSGVRKFVFSGVYHPSLSIINHANKRPIEEALYESGMDFTILQPAIYMQNFIESWNDILAHKQITMPYSNLSKMAYVDFREVAEVIALAMTGTELAYGTFELSATGMYNRFQLAEILSEITDRRITAVEISQEKWSQQVQMPDNHLKEGLFRMFQHYDKYGFAGGNSLVMKSILGREPRSIYQFFQELKYYPSPIPRI